MYTEERKQKVDVDPLKQLYMEQKDLLRTEKDALGDDISDIFAVFLEDKIKNEELINVGITGEVATGKSTVGLQLQKTIFEILEEEGKTKVKDIYPYILADQQELVRFIRVDEDNLVVKENVCILIDEYSSIGEGGLNATTENQLLEYFSNVFAQKFIHRVSCSPATIHEKNIHVLLDVIGKDIKKKVTRCRLRYRSPVDRETVTLGFVDIEVKEILSEDYYKKYRKKKFKRMELLSKEGVRDVRELEYAKVTLNVWDMLKKYAAVKKPTKDVILSAVEKVCRKEKAIYSLLAQQEIVSRSSGILGTWYEYKNVERKMHRKKKADDIDLEYNKYERDIVKSELNNVITSFIEEQRRLTEIYGEYQDIN